MKKIFVVAFIAIFAGMILSSCEKEKVEKTNPISNLKSSLEMRVFEDVAALNDEVAKTTQMSFEDLVQYENTIGFNSFGKISEQILYPIVEKSEELSYEQLCDLVTEHSEYLQLKEFDGDMDFDAKYTNSPFRYVMNQNRMVKAGNTLYKIFENGFVTCNSQYYDKLMKMTEIEFNSLQNDDLIFTIYRKSSNSQNFGGQDYYVAKKSPDGKYKISYSATYIPGEYIENGNYLTNAYYHTKSQVKKRFLGIYWPCRAAITNFVQYNFIVVGNSIIKNDDIGLGSINPPYKLENNLKFGTVHRIDHSTDVYIQSIRGSVLYSNVSLNISE